MPEATRQTSVKHELGRVTRRWLAGLGAGAALAWTAGAAQAQLVGGEVTHGSATVTQTPTDTGIDYRIETRTRRTRTTWDQHDIPAGYSLHVQQPDKGSNYLAQVSDARMTVIDGVLTSNGGVWISNPAGVYFGGSAVVDVARLVAGAGEVSAHSFLLGQRHFTNLQGEVRNDGSIVADGVSLIGRTVANHGQIVARRGDIVMAAGDEVWLKRHDTHIEVHVPAAAGDAPAVENTGRLETGPRGRARLAAGDLLGLAIRNTGEIRAGHIALEAGEGSLVDVQGTLDASRTRKGRRGGTIEIEGDAIFVRDALLDASGTRAGGSIEIGGEAGGGTGAGDELRPARAVVVDADSEIRADATRHGEGGEIVVWSDQLTMADGRLSARGGPEGGRGGFVETSSKGQLLVNADVDVSASGGSSGTWLLDPIDVYIVDDPATVTPDPPAVEDLLSEDASPTLSFFDFLPAIDAESIPDSSYVTTGSIENALVRGSQVVVTTEARFLTLTSENGVGNITVLDDIIVPVDAPTRPGTGSQLFLLAANDVRVEAPIASQNDNLALSVTFEANDNALTSSSGQPEAPDQQGTGSVFIDADISTNGGSVGARGVDIILNDGVTIDTSRLSGEGAGGLVNFQASNPDPEPGEVSEVVIRGNVLTDGGTFFAGGQSFLLESPGIIDVFGTEPDGDGDFVNGGAVDLAFLNDVVIDADMVAETLLLDAATSGEGTLVIGSSDLVPVTLSADQIALGAGDGTPGSDNDRDAGIAIGAAARFVDSGDENMDRDTSAAPSSFQFVQDRFIVDADLPEAGQFGDAPADIIGMRYGIESRDGNPDATGFDIVLDDPSKVAGADLGFVVPDSISITAPILPRNVALTVIRGFQVTPELADNLRPQVDPMDGSGGILQIRAGLEDNGNLTFGGIDPDPDDGIPVVVRLEAARIALQAGDPDGVNPGDNGTGNRSQVIVENTAEVEVELVPSESLSIRQDASIGERNIPMAAQLAGSAFPDIEYVLQSEGGNVTLSDASKFEDPNDPDGYVRDLTLTALGIIDIQTPAPLRVGRADIGGFAGFQLAEETLAQLDIQPLNPGDPRILTIRSGNGNLGFQSEGQDENGNLVPVQLRVEADFIQLVGATIDVETGRPLFQKDDQTSPDRLIFVQAAQVGDSSLPTQENFPDGLGPSELFVVQSSSGIGVSQAGDQPDENPDTTSDRFWRFPVQESTQVVLTAPQVNVFRNDGFNLVFGPNDHVWATNARLQAVFDASIGDGDPNTVDIPPINFRAVNARDIGSIFGFDPSIDFSETSFGTPMETDADGNEMPLVVGVLTIDQDNDLALRSGNDWLPDFDDTPGDLAYQPDTYSLISREGSIEVENDRLENTRLVLSVDAAEGEIIDFDDEVLDVVSLFAQTGGAFQVDDGTRVNAERSITLLSDAFGTASANEGSLSFGSGVELEAESILLQASIQGSASDETKRVDARTNAPIFRLPDGGEFGIAQGGAIRNGLAPGASFGDVDWGLIPAVAQFQGGVLDGYSLESRSGDIEINDVSEIQLARSVSLFAATAERPATLTIRADTLPAGGCADDAVCGTLADGDLDLIPDGSVVESLFLQAGTILLEAPEGFVDAGDPRIAFNVLGENPRLAIRQREAIQASPTDAARLPDRLQIVGGFDDTPYEIQSLLGITLGEDLADRVENSNLILIAGIAEDDFDAAFGTTRGQPPVPDEDEEVPDHVYDRFADLDGNGVIDAADDAAFDLLAGQVTIQGSNPFELVLRSILIESDPELPGETPIPIRIGDVEIQTEADQIYRDEVQIIGDAVLTARAGVLEQLDALFTAPASSIVFEEEVYGETAGADRLTVQATNRVRFAKNVGTRDGLRLGLLEINLQQLIQLEAEPPIPRAEFGVPDRPGEIRIAADQIRLNPQDPRPDGGTSLYVRRQIPDAATFFRRGGDLVFDLGDGGSFEMGQNEKLSVDGANLRILAPNGTAEIGDLAALDTIEVDAATIRMRRRGPGPVLRANGRLEKDAGVDYVAKSIRFRDGANDHDSRGLHRNQTGNGRDARFGIEDAVNAPAFMDEFSVVGLAFNVLDGPGLDFAGGDLVVDGVPDGVSRAQLGDIYPDRRPQVPIAVPVAYRVRDPEALADVGIDVRRPTPQELRNAARGAAVFEDLDSLQPDGRLHVAEVRLVAEEVEKAVALHDEVFAQDGRRAPQVRQVLQAAVDDYRRSTGARRIVGFELRRYVYNRPSSQFEAYQELQKLDALFRHHRRSGLTASEYRRIQREWLASIQPEGISLQELSEFIHPSRYVRGSDVLDVFGD